MKIQIGENTVELKKQTQVPFSEKYSYEIIVNSKVVGTTYRVQPSDYDSFGVYRKMGQKLWTINMNSGYERIRIKFSSRHSVAKYVLAMVLQKSQEVV